MCRHYVRNQQTGVMDCRKTGRPAICFENRDFAGCPIRPRPADAPAWTGPTPGVVRLRREESHE